MLKFFVLKKSRYVSMIMNWLNTLLALSLVSLLIYTFGFHVAMSADLIYFVSSITFASLFIELLFEAIWLFYHNEKFKGKLSYMFFSILMFLLSIVHLLPDSLMKDITILEALSHDNTIILISSIMAILKLSFVITNSLSLSLSPNKLFVSSFIFLIFAGAALLMLPKCSNDINYLQALFTSVSAVCVTGLSVVDISSAYTVYGHCLIMILIQLGGIGIMTFTSFFGLMFVNKHISQNKLLIKEMIDPSTGVNNIFMTLRNIILIAFFIEAVGACAIYFSLDSSVDSRLFTAIFHSVSAFCNAGFSTLSGGLMNDAFRNNIYALQSVAWLIVLGGIGFPLMFNIKSYVSHYFRNQLYILFGKRAKYTYKSHIITSSSVLVMSLTAILLVLGTVIFYATENDNILANLSFIEKLNMAFFMSVTPRTAGFNPFDMGQLSPLTATIMIIFMWIGASPMSTGGGVKTTTIGIAFLNIWNTLRGRSNIEVRKRKVSHETVNKTFLIIFVSLLVIESGVILVSIFDPKQDAQAVVFEVVSAFSTVGLSLNITDKLSVNSQIVLMCIMFIGRMGLLTLLSCFVKVNQYQQYDYPTESVPVT